MIPEIVTQLKQIGKLVSDGALKKIGDFKILDPSAFEFSQLPDEYQAIVAAAFNNIQESTWVIIDDAGQFVPGAKQVLTSHGFSLEKKDLGSGSKEFILRAPKFDMILVA